jgi:hypothetical protein
VTGLELLYPAGPAETADPLATVLDRMGVRREPFAPGVIDFLDGLSRDLFPLVREDASLAPLAFFVRRGNMQRLADGAAGAAEGKGVLVPQGAVFHVPPTNVDTLFLYTVAITLLTGNSNVVRISRNAGPATYRIVDLLKRRLDKHPDVAELVTIISFDRDPEILDAISLRCDMRMIWGGDAAINSIRKSRLAPSAKELTFPDRVSLAAVSVPRWQDTDDATRTQVVEGLYNDTFWFDQMACSSPVHLLLVGGEDAAAEDTRRSLTRSLAEQAERRYAEVDGQAINKMVDIMRAMDRGLAGLDWVSNSVVTVGGARVEDAAAIRPGGGFFSTQHVASLVDIGQQLSRRIQTLSVFGFSRDELDAFVRGTNGAGIDRIVPIGHALDFAAIWDGKDLVAESLRYVTIDPA